MDQTITRSAPYFDLDALRQEASDLACAYSGQDSSLRAALVERLRQLVDEALTESRRQLERDGDGRACAEGLSAFQDALIRLAHDFTTHHVYRAKNPSSAEHMAIVATGGYGRGLLAPGSDIDLLFLLPYKQTPWGESVVEAMLYILWDLRQKVGHATRSVAECIRQARADMTIRTTLLEARFLIGSLELFNELQDAFDREVARSDASEFVAAKLAE